MSEQFYLHLFGRPTLQVGERHTPLTYTQPWQLLIRLALEPEKEHSRLYLCAFVCQVNIVDIERHDSQRFKNVVAILRKKLGVFSNRLAAHPGHLRLDIKADECDLIDFQQAFSQFDSAKRTQQEEAAIRARKWLARGTFLSGFGPEPSCEFLQQKKSEVHRMAVQILEYSAERHHTLGEPKLSETASEAAEAFRLSILEPNAIETRAVNEDLHSMINELKRILSFGFTSSQFFVQRNDVADFFTDILQPLRRGLTCVGLWGLAGMGKTQAALNWSQSRKWLFPNGVYWLNGNILRMAGTGIVIDTNPMSTASAMTNPVLSLDSFLLYIAKMGKFLVVIDDIRDHILLSRILKLLSTAEFGALIVTSSVYDLVENFIPLRNSKQLLRLVDGFGVANDDISNAETGAMLLWVRANKIVAAPPQQRLAWASASPQEKLDAEALCRRLDGLPLALAQAGAYIANNPGLTMADYLELYNRFDTGGREIRMLFGTRVSSGKLGTGTSVNDHASIAITFRLTFTNVVKSASAEMSEACKSLLQLVCFFDQSPIPVAFFEDAHHHLPDALYNWLYPEGTWLITRWNSLVDHLRRWSLVDLSSDGKEFRFHGVAAVILQDILHERDLTSNHQDYLHEPDVTFGNEKPVWANAWKASVEVIRHGSPDISKSGARWWEVARLRSHWEHIIGLADEAYDDEWATESFSDILSMLGTWYRLNDEMERSEKCLRRAMKTGFCYYNKMDLNYAIALNNLGLTLIYCGTEACLEAIELYRKSIHIREAHLSRVDLKDTIKCKKLLSGIALCYDNRGLAYDELRIFGPAISDHRHAIALQRNQNEVTASTLNNLARPLFATGEVAEAEALYEECLAMFPSDDLDAIPGEARILCNYADLLTKTQRSYLAEVYARRAFVIYMRLVGPVVSGRTGKSMHTIADTWLRCLSTFPNKILRLVKKFPKSYMNLPKKWSILPYKATYDAYSLILNSRHMLLIVDMIKAVGIGSPECVLWPEERRRLLRIFSGCEAHSGSCRTKIHRELLGTCTDSWSRQNTESQRRHRRRKFGRLR